MHSQRQRSHAIVDDGLVFAQCAPRNPLIDARHSLLLRGGGHMHVFYQFKGSTDGTTKILSFEVVETWYKQCYEKLLKLGYNREEIVLVYISRKPLGRNLNSKENVELRKKTIQTWQESIKNCPGLLVVSGDQTAEFLPGMHHRAVRHIKEQEEKTAIKQPNQKTRLK
jgi:hypothetical protein